MANFSMDHVLTWSEATLAVIAAFSTVFVVMKSIYRMARNVEKLVETGAANSQRLEKIENQMTLNGGSSLRDAVQRIENRLAVLEHIPIPGKP